MELLIVIVIIAILATLLVPVISKLRARAQRTMRREPPQSICRSRPLRAAKRKLAADTSQHVGHRIGRVCEGLDRRPFTFGVGAKVWICPTIQNLLRNPDYLEPANVRIDYMPMPFDDKPTTPHEWPRQPWFAERGDVHGSGNLIIFTDGSISDLKGVLSGVRSPP